MRPLTKHLRDFSRPVLMPPGSPALSSADRESNCDDHYERGVEDALARSSHLIEEAINFAAAEIRALRSEWGAECTESALREAAESRAAFETGLSKSLALALEPFIKARQRERILNSFLDQVKEIALKQPDISVVVRGPSNDAEIVVARLDKCGVRTRIAPSEDRGLTASVGQTIVRANTNRWAQLLEREFGGDGDVEE